MKNYTEIFIKRPVMSSAISLLIFIIGLFSLTALPLRLFPDIASPVIEINTVYIGASAEVMNNYVTAVIENALAGIDGVNYMSASSSQDSSHISLVMQLGFDPKIALSAVMAKVSAMSAQLPRDAQKPEISVGNGDGESVMYLALTSQQLGRRELAEYVRQGVKPKLDVINGVSEVQILGRINAMRLWLNPIKMASRGVIAEDINRAVNNENVITAAGKTDAHDTYFDITATTDLHSVEEFNNILIKSQNGTYVHLSDIGYAATGDQASTISTFYNGQPATMISIKLLPEANPVLVTDQIKKILPAINASLPLDVKIYNVFDEGRYIHEAIHEVVRTLIITIGIVTLVIYLFLGSLRALLIPVITIPLSLIGVCSLLALMGFSINTLTLLAMVLGIGLVVDDAIVIVENIFRHMETGMSVIRSVIEGTREVSYSVIGMSITLAAVYAPIAFSKGLTGQLFKEFAVTLSGAVIISGIIALTLSPMLCSRWLNADSLKSNFNHLIETYQKKILFRYQRVLHSALNNSKKCLSIWAGIIFSLLILFNIIPKQLAPEEDQGVLLAISSAPNYTNSNFIYRYANEVMSQFNFFKESEQKIIIAGVPSEHQALAFIILDEWNKRTKSAMELQPELQKLANQVPGVQTIIINPPSLPGEGDMPLQIVLKSTEPFEILYNQANELISSAWGSHLFNFVQLDLNYDQPVLKLNINKNAAHVLGISMQAISDSLNLMLGGNKIQEYTENSSSYFVIPQVEPQFRTNPSQLYNIHLKTASGKLVPLSSVAKIITSVQPEQLNQFQKMNAITITGQMAKHHSLQEGIHFFQKITQQKAYEPITLDYSGGARQFMTEGQKMPEIFLTALIIIFIVLAIQFESYRSPFIILLGSAPFAIFSACLALELGAGTLNIYTQIGLLTLVGLITKHGILITDFANKMQQSGLTKYEAIVEAASMRFRPILMTTSAMVLGVMPLVLAKQKNAGVRTKPVYAKGMSQ
jgi:multidrug efflux pump